MILYLQHQQISDMQGTFIVATEAQSALRTP